MYVSPRHKQSNGFPLRVLIKKNIVTMKDKEKKKTIKFSQVICNKLRSVESLDLPRIF